MSLFGANRKAQTYRCFVTVVLLVLGLSLGCAAPGERESAAEIDIDAIVRDRLQNEIEKASVGDHNTCEFTDEALQKQCCRSLLSDTYKHASAADEAKAEGNNFEWVIEAARSIDAVRSYCNDCKQDEGHALLCR